MKAVVLRHHGDEDSLEHLDWPDPVPGPGEVLIRVGACGLNHVDLDVRAGSSRFTVDLPRILGREIAGEVVALGPGATERRLGDRVAAGEMFTACWQCEQCLGGSDNLCWNVDYPGLFRDGGYAELVTVPARNTARVPDNLSFIAAAASQVGFGTAWRALLQRSLGLLPQDVVLITAAASGVGSAGIQVAKLVGCRVIAVVGSAEKEAAVRELGADWTVDHSKRAVDDAVREITSGRGVDVAFEIAGGRLFQEAMRSLRYGGRLVLAGAHSGEQVETDLIPIFRYERAIIGTARATLGEMSRVFAALAAGQLRPVIDSTFPLHQAADAHRRMASRRNVGKVVLVP